MLKHTADDDTLSCQPVARCRRLLGAERKLQTVAAQTFDDGPVVGIVEVADDALGHHLADALHLLQFVEAGCHECIHRLEVVCQQTGRRLAYEPDAQGEDHAFERHLARLAYGVHNLLRRLRARAVAIDLLHLDVVEVGYVLDQPPAVVLVNGLRAQRVDVHGLARNEVLDASLDLRCAARVVGTVPGCLALVAHQRRAALRTALRKLHGLGNDGALVDVYANNLGDNLAALLNVHHVADMQVEATDEVLVVQRGTPHGGACQLYGLHVGNGRHGTRASHLVGDLQQSGTLALGLELIGNGPSGRLGCITE